MEKHGNAVHNDGFFEAGVLQAKESDRRSSVVLPEVKVIANGHCHGTFLLDFVLDAESTLNGTVTENCRRVQGVWMCFGGGG